MKRVVLQVAAVDEGPPVRQDHHAVAEHVPASDCVTFMELVCGFQTAARKFVSAATLPDRTRSAHRQCDEREMHRVDRHEVGQRSPLSSHGCLGASRVPSPAMANASRIDPARSHRGLRRSLPLTVRIPSSFRSIVAVVDDVNDRDTTADAATAHAMPFGRA